MYLHLLSAASLHPFPCPIQYLNSIREGILSSLFMEYPEHVEQFLVHRIPNKCVEWMSKWVPHW